MLSHSDKVAVAVSGGKDSLALLYILKKFFKEHGRTDLIAITIDEGIAGYREESLQIVRDFCSRIQVKSKICSYGKIFGVDMDHATQNRPSEKTTSCSMCGTFRRRIMDIMAESVGANVLATAHNLDDHLQTFLINVISGDVERIGWMYPEPVQYGPKGLKKVKPFVEIYEHEIVFYALLRDIPFQSDQCPYMKESIRTDIRDFLNNLESSHAGVKYNAFNTITKISKVLKDSATDGLTNYTKCQICGRRSTQQVCSVCSTLKVLTNPH
jgi:uncharacterized protein (TIGR00269 family)